jgi:hypothetical protein
VSCWKVWYATFLIGLAPEGMRRKEGRYCKDLSAPSARIWIDIGYRARYPSICIILLRDQLSLIILTFLVVLAQWSRAESLQLYSKNLRNVYVIVDEILGY